MTGSVVSWVRRVRSKLIASDVRDQASDSPQASHATGDGKHCYPTYVILWQKACRSNNTVPFNYSIWSDHAERPHSCLIIHEDSVQEGGKECIRQDAESVDVPSQHLALLLGLTSAKAVGMRSWLSKACFKCFSRSTSVRTIR